MITVGSLFSGIGGLDLGLERAGMRVVWQCEIDPYCQAVLRHHWPDVRLFSDIREMDGSAPTVDLICGGFPCQPVSLAGKGLAQEDPRWLWPEFARVVGCLQPRYVLVENVPGLVKRGLLDVLTDLAEMGFDAEWQIVSAASQGAPHLRERLFVIAYAQRSQLWEQPGWLSWEGGEDTTIASVDGEERDVVAYAARDVRGQSAQAGAIGERARQSGSENGARNFSDTQCNGLEGFIYTTAKTGTAIQPFSWWESEPPVGRVADGVPNRVAQLRALGNAVVPQVAEFVGRLIVEADAT